VLSDHFGRLRTLAAILAVSALLSGTLGFLRGLSLAVLTAIVLVYGLAVLRSNSGGRIT